MVAGRVDASIKAARSTARMVKIFAVEKNPGAVVTSVRGSGLCLI